MESIKEQAPICSFSSMLRAFLPLPFGIEFSLFYQGVKGNSHEASRTEATKQEKAKFLDPALTYSHSFMMHAFLL